MEFPLQTFVNYTKIDIFEILHAILFGTLF